MVSEMVWKSLHRKSAPLAMVLSVGAFSCALAVAQNNIVRGVVKNASGEPVAGAFVKVRSADARLTYMVVSQDGGRYYTPSILPGKYTVQSFGGGYQSTVEGPLEVSAGQGASAELVLGTPQKVYPPVKKYTDTELRAMLPEGEGKKLLLSHCVVCHTPENYVGRRQNHDGWEKSVDAMRFYLQSNPERRAEFKARTGIDAQPLTDQEKAVIVDYLAANFPPDKPPLYGPPPNDPNRHLPRTFLKGAVTKYVATELNIGNGVQAGAFVLDEQGTVWISEKTSGILGRLDPKTFSYTRIFTPPGNNIKDAFSTVGIDPKGQIWFTSSDGPHSQWFQYDPKSQKVVNSYDVPVASIPGGDILFNTLVFPSNGTVWATSTAKHRLVKLDPATRKVTEFPVRIGQHPFGMTIGGDQMIWFSGDEDNLIVKADPASGQMTPYKLPTPNTRPRRIATDADGNLWANTLHDGRLVKVEYRTGKITEYPVPTHDQGQGIEIDKRRNLIWFGEYGAIQIGRFDPASSQFVEFPLTNADAQPWIIRLDPGNPNRVWWNSRIGVIGYVELIQ